ncbi:MAG: hypothetical protein JOY64_23635 [Alphaproteobacteria bacterium]|nr:hypothetical protein [Alphaproteobacteria bacterium]
MPGGDPTLAYLLELDGEEIVYDGGYVARFRAKRVKPTPEKPHGISYSLTFHGPDGRRLMGYDNAHSVPHRGGRFVRGQMAFDHWHRDETDEGRAYRFKDAGKLIGDFFDEIERILEEADDGQAD